MPEGGAVGPRELGTGAELAIGRRRQLAKREGQSKGERMGLRGWGSGYLGTGHKLEKGEGEQGVVPRRMVRLSAPSGAGREGDGGAQGTARAHLAAQCLPPAGLPLGRFGPCCHPAGGAQRTPISATQQLQRSLRGRAVARRCCGRLLERQQAAAERRAAGLHSALPAVISTLRAGEGPILLRPEAHHARPAEAMAAVGAHRLAGHPLAQGAGGLGRACGKRQGGGGDPGGGRGRRGGRERT